MGASSPLTVAIFGASGVAGSGVLEQSLADPRIAEVRVIVRRPLAVSAPKLRQFETQDFLDFGRIQEAFTGIDACFYCLGVSVSHAPTEPEYRRIHFDYALAAARAVQAGSPNAIFHFLSGEGARWESRFMWARVKAQAEKALGELGMAGLLVYRPGYIHPREPAPNRAWTEKIARALYPLYSWWEIASIQNTDLGKAMILTTVAGKREGLLDNRTIRRLAKRYAAASSIPAKPAAG